MGPSTGPHDAEREATSLGQLHARSRLFSQPGVWCSSKFDERTAVAGVISTLRKTFFHFLSNRMGYDRGDSFPFDFEPNEILFGSKSKGKLSPRSYPIQCERKWKHNFLSVGD